MIVADPLFDRLARALAGRYTLVRELGRGGMATVYLGTDVKLGRQVAIKLLAPATRAYLGSDRFQRESCSPPSCLILTSSPCSKRTRPTACCST